MSDDGSDVEDGMLRQSGFVAASEHVGDSEGQPRSMGLDTARLGSVQQASGMNYPENGGDQTGKRRSAERLSPEKARLKSSPAKDRKMLGPENVRPSSAEAQARLGPRRDRQQPGQAVARKLLSPEKIVGEPDMLDRGHMKLITALSHRMRNTTTKLSHPKSERRRGSVCGRKFMYHLDNEVRVGCGLEVCPKIDTSLVSLMKRWTIRQAEVDTERGQPPRRMVENGFLTKAGRTPEVATVVTTSVVRRACGGRNDGVSAQAGRVPAIRMMMTGDDGLIDPSLFDATAMETRKESRTGNRTRVGADERRSRHLPKKTSLLVRRRNGGSVRCFPVVRDILWLT